MQGRDVDDEPVLRGRIAPQPSELKTREILRVIYPLNNSGSKQIIISLDPTSDFSPIITIGRPGWSGYQLTPETFKVLCEYAEYIDDYFAHPALQRQYVPISSCDKVEFRKSWGKDLIAITNTLDCDVKVTIAKTTWEGLKRLFPLVKHTLDLYDQWQVDAMLVFMAFAKHLKDNLPQDVFPPGTIVQNSVNFQTVCDRTSLSDLQFDHVFKTNLDMERCFREIQVFCADHLASYLPFI